MLLALAAAAVLAATIETPNSAGVVRIVPVRTSDFRGVRRFF